VTNTWGFFGAILEPPFLGTIVIERLYQDQPHLSSRAIAYEVIALTHRLDPGKYYLTEMKVPDMPFVARLIRCLFSSSATLVALLLLTQMAVAAESSGLPLPRFVSLRSDEVNLRTGPGVRYPVDWIYTRRDLPVEVIAEFETWRKIRDWQGTEGWVHQSMLAARRMVVILGQQRRLRAEPDENALSLALIDPNVTGRLIACPRGKVYCRVEIDNIQGWLKRDEFWGVYQGEYIE
jgi:SH3-like domain-containing protein